MKIELEQQDIDLIADKVIEKMKPILATASMQEQRDNLMTVSSLAEYMAVSVPFIYKLTQAKEIPHIKKGNKLILFRRKDIDKWLDSYHIPALQQSRRISKLFK